ncbi:MAG: DUF799 family lipoprotein [Desulfobacterales bacterium]|nr:DUF799 family lipoprotein [Desulfobacterales bacterium]
MKQDDSFQKRKPLRSPAGAEPPLGRSLRLCGVVLRLCFAVLFLLAMFAGCAGLGKFQRPEADKKYRVKDFTVSEQLKASPPQTIAILPFENLTDKKEAFEIVRKTFYNQFSFKTFHDVELHRIDTVLASKDLLSRQKYLDVNPSELGRLLNADALIYGKITTFDRLMMGVYSEVTISASLKMLDCASGEVLWKACHSAKHRGGGPPTSIFSIIPNVIFATLNIRDIELLRVADDLSRDLVETIPAPAVSDVLKAPQIKLVAHDSGNRPRKAGDTIDVVLIGEPGHIATFDIAGFKQGIPMHEGPEGSYNGIYKVFPGENIQEALVIGRLTDGKGNTSEWIDPLGILTIDTTPPEVPEELNAQGRDTFINLTWLGVDGPDLAGYNIYRSESPLTSFKTVKNVELSQYTATSLRNFTPYYYKVSAVDQAGNESPLSDYVTAIPVKPGPTEVSGTIGVDTIWYMGASPYVVTDTVTVLNGSTLKIEPGTVIQSSGSGIVIQGRLIAKGEPNNCIQFKASDTAPDRRWEGIKFDNTNDSESSINYSKIKDAEIGVEAITSSPDISHNMMLENGDGLMFREFCESTVQHNMIKQNQGCGIRCVNSAVKVQYNTITENAAEGVLCTSAMPLITENNIYGNEGQNLSVKNTGDNIVNAINNWWGGTALEKVVSGISGPVYYAEVLNAPYPEGKSITLEKPVEPEKPKEASAPQPPAIEDTATLTELGDRYLEENRLHDALAVFKKLLTLESENDSAHFKAGLIHYQMGEIEAAVQEMQKAAALNPEHTGYRYNLGLVLSEAGRMEEAVSEWKKVLEVEPANENAKMLVEMYSK